MKKSMHIVVLFFITSMLFAMPLGLREGMTAEDFILLFGRDKVVEIDKSEYGNALYGLNVELNTRLNEYVMINVVAGPEGKIQQIMLKFRFQKPEGGRYTDIVYDHGLFLEMYYDIIVDTIGQFGFPFCMESDYTKRSVTLAWEMRAGAAIDDIVTIMLEQYALFDNMFVNMTFFTERYYQNRGRQ